MKNKYAFPSTWENETVKLCDDQGMTLRDYFAAKALQGMLAETSLKATPEEFADQAYELAEAMLKARAKWLM